MTLKQGFLRPKPIYGFLLSDKIYLFSPDDHYHHAVDFNSCRFLITYNLYFSNYLPKNIVDDYLVHLWIWDWCLFLLTLVCILQYLQILEIVKWSLNLDLLLNLWTSSQSRLITAIEISTLSLKLDLPPILYKIMAPAEGDNNHNINR